MNTPIAADIVNRKLEEGGITEMSKTSIREIVRLVNHIEKESGEKFIRMEMGVPGLPAARIGIEAEKKALDMGVASLYPNIEGIAELKDEGVRFVKNFLDVVVNRRGIVPTVGSMMGGLASFLVANRNNSEREGTLFIDPGFPVQKQQIRMIGQEYRSFDVYNYRGKALEPKVRSYLDTGLVSSILYSNPNNPSWICFTEEELEIIGRLAKEYDVIVIEDLAYFGMDFRKDYAEPGKPPYQPSVAKYCDDYILLISMSKAFSYAGQRIGLMVMSDHLRQRRYPELKRFYGSDEFGHAMIFGALYSLSSGVAHTAQYAAAAMLKAVNEGSFRFLDEVREYEKKAVIMKDLFTKNGFTIVYDQDLGEPLADGFYFTLSYPGMNGDDLLKSLLYYGISAISLRITGSERHEGLRACVSQVRMEQMPVLEERLRQFSKDYPIS